MNVKHHNKHIFDLSIFFVERVEKKTFTLPLKITNSFKFYLNAKKKKKKNDEMEKIFLRKGFLPGRYNDTSSPNHLTCDCSSQFIPV